MTNCSQMDAKRFQFFFIVFSIAFTTCCSDDQQFMDCSALYKCGHIKNLGYPFWGHVRPEFCGRQGFELKCYDDLYPVMDTGSLEFRILEINQSSHMMRIARMDFWGESCPKNFTTTTTATALDPSLFNYANANRNLILFYGCSHEFLSQLPDDWTFGNTFTCQIEGINGSAALYFDESIAGADSPITRTCVINVTLPVLVAAFEELNRAFDELNRNRTMNETISKEKLEEALNMGFDVEYNIDGGLCLACTASGGICGSSKYTATGFICLCHDKPQELSCPDSGSKIRSRNLVVAIATAGTGILFTCFLMVCCSGRKFSQWRKKSDGDQSIEAYFKNHGPLAPKRYSYSDVKKMTKSFKDKLGQGGYGSVYKGKLVDGGLVAVKVLNKSKGNGEEFINEVASISQTSHVNIVNLLGFCFEGDKKALVYEFMGNGSLEKFLCNGNPLKASKHLGWEKLYQIAIGIARGLDYLHCGCKTRILHFDVKPHNILLDQDFSPKISDFGLAKLCLRKESIVSISAARGTIGYVAPEVVCRNFGGVSHKSDVYSYGMMVLEMVGGGKHTNGTIDHTSDTDFPHWIYKHLEVEENVGLQDVENEEENEITKKMILVGLWCIQTDPSHKPSMSKAIEMLEGSIEALQIPPKPFLSSHPRLSLDSSSFKSTPQ